MRSRAKLFGHPIHPMLIVFPLGLLASSLIFDVISLASRNGDWSVAAFYMIAGGVVGGLIAAVFGLIDWIAIPAGTRARAVGAWHGLGNVVVVALFAVSWVLRFNHRQHTDSTPFLLSILGVALALVTGWLGGELVGRLGIGVDEGANADAPNSLTGRPAIDSRLLREQESRA
ncbi:MAG: DUF2231 domain-containing protein [Myxococcales bacterium]